MVETASGEKEGLVGNAAGAVEKGGGLGGDGVAATAEDEVGEGDSAESSANAVSKKAAAGQKDVLADLSKLKQEVDALRGRYEGV